MVDEVAQSRFIRVTIAKRDEGGKLSDSPSCSGTSILWCRGRGRALRRWRRAPRMMRGLCRLEPRRTPGMSVKRERGEHKNGSSLEHTDD